MYQLTTEMTCDLPVSFLQERHIVSIKMSYHIGNETYRDGDADAPAGKALYDVMRAGTLVRTTLVNTADYEAFFEPYLQAGTDVLHVSFSSGLSGSCQAAMVAAEELNGRYDHKVTVVDSLCACMGQGLLVYYADENRNAGMTMDENAAWLNAHKKNLCHWFTVDDLMFLHRGGRVSKTAAIVGSLLNIKPVLHVDNDGHLILVSKVRGRAAAIKALADKAVETRLPGENVMFVSNADCEQDAKMLMDQVEARTSVRPILMNSIGAVIGSHAGPGTLALFFMGKER